MDQDKVLLEIVEKIGGITASMKSMELMLDRSLDSSKKQHDKIWEKVDHHSKWINRMKGSLAVISGVFGLFYMWFKAKFGGH